MNEILKSDINKVKTEFSTLLPAKNSQSEELDSINCNHIKHIPIVNKPVQGDVWNVYVSNINSLKLFHVQNIENYEYIQSISSELEKYVSTSKKLPKVGNLIAARDYNGFWYRAKVQSITEMGLYVCFIDYGISKVLVTDFKDLPKEFISVKPMAYRCYFKSVSNEDDNQLSALDLFDSIYKFYSSYQITATFLSNNDPYFVTLSHNGNNVFDILYNLVWEGIVPNISEDPINFAKFKMLNEKYPNSRTTVTHIEPILSMNHFYVETELSYQIGIDIRTEIENQTKWIPELHPEEGQIVIAKSTNDLKLYRARVIMKYDDREEYRCFLIDYIKFENCSELFDPSDYLRTAPPVKIHCSLNVSKNVSSHFLESMNLAFINEIADCIDKSKTMHIKKIGNPCVIDLEIDDLNIIQVIKPCEVRMIHVLNFNSFKVRLNSLGAKKILDVLNSTKKCMIVSNPEIFKLYVAKIQTQYKRVKYMGENKTSFKVKLIDEEHQKIIVNELYALPKSIINVKTTDLFCSLELNKTSYSNKLFVEICNNGNTKFKMVIIKSNHIHSHIVKLFLESKDITSIICNPPT
ncbi:tudor domain-containing 6-like [Rhopalosiphum padi]|uniref:tudor domain-containing 6-like n=1 Tax=Rhopalosiphum padi TaxID=40932 RepID=UPI00298D6394|nr:tudor domain-containing 6-like [Rhopalosiphum padi]